MEPYHKFKVSYDYDEDLEGYDRQKDVEDQFNEHLAALPHLSPVDYVVVRTGYTDRILSDAASLAELEDALVVFNYDLMHPAFVRDPVVQDLVTAALGNAVGGSTVFNYKSAHMIFSGVSNLGSLDFCACCDISNVHQVSWYTAGDKVILYCEVDTESG